MGPPQFGRGGNPVRRVGAKHYAYWTVDDIVVWFGIRYQWPPSVVLAQPIGDLARICWAVKEADRKRRERKEQD